MSSRKFRKGASRYQVTNWKEYESGLIMRGSITFWVARDTTDGWYATNIVKQRGSQIEYSDLAIQTSLMLRSLYKLPLRQTEGFINSLFKLMHVQLISPDHTTMSRRAVDLKIAKESIKKDKPINILIDSTGLKTYGDGEWHEKKHGLIRKKQWRKLHIAVDEDTQEIVAGRITKSEMSDVSQVLPLLDQVESDIDTVKADGAYDSSTLRKLLDKSGIKSVFPPRKDAILSSDYLNNPTQRDKDILRIQKDGREIWEYASGYSKRNLVENAMYRYKNNIGAQLRSKEFARQETEVAIGLHLLNQMTGLGMPNSVRIR
jgi:hypothetical protein